MSLLIFFTSWVLASSLPEVNVKTFPEVKALQKDMPRPILSFILRKTECLYWNNHVVYDAKKIQKINEQKVKLKCDDLENEDAKLRKKYHENTRVIDVLNKLKNLSL